VSTALYQDDNVGSLYDKQHVAASTEEAARLAIVAGNDMIMSTPSFYGDALALSREGAVDMALIDDSVRHRAQTTTLLDGLSSRARREGVEVSSTGSTSRGSRSGMALGALAASRRRHRVRGGCRPEGGPGRGLCRRHHSQERCQ
jgi:beta-glucosidase-like glycosyl hydrolase